MALNIPLPLKGFWQGAKYIPIAAKYQSAGTNGCKPLERFGLREEGSRGEKTCLGGGLSPILPVHKGLQRFTRESHANDSSLHMDGSRPGNECVPLSAKPGVPQARR